MSNFARVLIVMFVFGYAACNEIEQRSRFLNRSFTTETPSPAPTPPVTSSRILAQDFNTAEAALSEAVNDKNASELQKGLSSRFTRVRTGAAVALGELDNATAVDALVEALKQNQGVIGGGTETQIEQNDLTRAIISALEKLMKCRFSFSKDLSSTEPAGYELLSPNAFQEVLAKTQKWCATRACK